MWNEELLDAVRCGEEARIPVLIAAGADINYVSSKGWTALGLAVAGGQEGIARLLMSLGAKTDVINPNGQDVAKLLAAA